MLLDDKTPINISLDNTYNSVNEGDNRKLKKKNSKPGINKNTGAQQKLSTELEYFVRLQEPARY